MRRIRRILLTACAALTLSTVASSAEAAERWVDRPMTLKELVFAGNVGLGLGHAAYAGGFSATGLGLNLEGALGVTDRFELGIRTGIRFGDDGRLTQADYYGRTLWTETYGTGLDTVANPELRARGVVYSGDVVEVGLDGRVYMPVEPRTRFGLMFGVPLAFHVSDILRIDTGAYLPMLFHRPVAAGLSIPGYFWFQVTEKLWLGPMAQVRLFEIARRSNLLLGFGLGYEVAPSVDLKTMLLLPAIDDGFARRIGAGVGIEFRLGE